MAVTGRLVEGVRGEAMRATTRVWVLAALALAISSCGGAAATQRVTAATGSPIVLFVSAGYTSPLGTGDGTIKQGAEAAAAAINKRGGVNGHPLVIVTCDNQGGASGAVACARQAASSNAVAAISMRDAYAFASMPIYLDQQLPLIGVVPAGNPETNVSSIAFPIQGGPVIEYIAAHDY